IEDGTVTMHLGNYSDLDRRRQRASRPVVAPEPRKSGRAITPGTARATANPGAAVDGVEDRIDELEAEVRRIEEQLADHQTYDDAARVTELGSAHEEAPGGLRPLPPGGEE